MQQDATTTEKNEQVIARNFKNAGLAFSFFAAITVLSVIVDGFVDVWRNWGGTLGGSLAAVEALIGLRVLRPVIAGVAFALGLAFLFNRPTTTAFLGWVGGQALGAFACVWGGVVGFVLAIAMRGLGLEPLMQVLLTSVYIVVLVTGCLLGLTKGAMGPAIGRLVGKIPFAARALITIPFLLLAPAAIVTVPLASITGAFNWLPIG